MVCLLEDNDENILTYHLFGKHAVGMDRIFKKLYKCLNLVNGNKIYDKSLIEGIREINFWPETSIY